MELYGWAQLTQQGTTPAEVRARLRTGSLERVRRGVYASVVELDAAQRHRRLVAATIEGLGPGSVISHFSAGLLLGLPVPLPPLDRVWVTRDGPRGHGRAKGCLRLLHAPLNASELDVTDSVVVTSLVRTAVDLACRLDFCTGVAVVDAAMARGATRESLEQTLDRARRVTGIVRARKVVAFADPRS